MSESTLQLVAAMRQAQKRYFKDRTQSALKESKRLEALVDLRLEFLAAQAGKQLTLDGSAS